MLTPEEIKGDYTIENAYLIKDIVTKEDGTLQILTENCHTSTMSEKMKMAYGSTMLVKASMTGNGPASSYTSTTDSYYNLSIAVIQFNNTGKLDWVAVVPKDQYSENDEGRYSSFVHISKGDNLYV